MCQSVRVVCAHTLCDCGVYVQASLYLYVLQMFSKMKLIESYTSFCSYE